MRIGRAAFLEALKKSRVRRWMLVDEDGHGYTTDKISVEQLVKEHLNIYLVRQGGKHKQFPDDRYFKQARICFHPAVQLGPKQRVYSVDLFSLTSKMRAPSFGLMAGPPSLGGTCPLAPAPSKAGYVCHNCYATGGNYSNPNIMVYSSVRKQFVRENIGEFVGIILENLKILRGSPAQLRMDENGLPANPNFFRIHDTGDIGWLSGYYKKWIEIARNVPDVMFWMPTRAWAADKYVAELKSRRPENMIVRPSPLYVDTDAPRVPYLDAGTSVCFHDVWNKHAQHNCPSIYPVKSNCEAQGCRKCWMKRTTTVNYEPHGEMTEKIREHIKRNPPASLDAMYSKYMHGGGPRSNPPPQNFAEWLAQNKVKLCSWSDEQWFDFLTSHGVEESRVGDWLEQTAEYD